MKTNHQPLNRAKLEQRKVFLETAIRDTSDPAAVIKLRGDYREVMDQLELFYDDERREMK